MLYARKNAVRFVTDGVISFLNHQSLLSLGDQGGYNQDGRIYFAEYYPNMLEILYKGKSASLYLCAPESVENTQIPNEAVSQGDVPILEEHRITDAYEALLEQERLGALEILRFHQLTEKNLEWVRKVQADIIRKHDLLNNPGPMADYYRIHYPESWKDVAQEQG